MESITVQQLLQLLSTIANYLLPVLFFVILVYVIIILNRIAKALKTVKCRIEDLENTITLVDENLNSLATTTKSIANISESIDNAHTKSKEQVKVFSNKIQDTLTQVQNKSKNLLKQHTIKEDE